MIVYFILFNASLKQTPEAVVDVKKSNFMWTDEETALLAQVVIDYEASQ